MNGAQVHLALSHFPIAGMFFAIPILIWGLLAKTEAIKRVGLLIVLVSAVSGVIMMESGEKAEEIVEHKPLVTKNLIHEHEDAAEAANATIIFCGVLSILYFALTKMKKSHTDKIYLVLILGNLIAAGLVANAAHLGGQIRHDELRATEGNSPVGSVKNETNESEEKDKD